MKKQVHPAGVEILCALANFMKLVPRASARVKRWRTRIVMRRSCGVGGPPWNNVDVDVVVDVDGIKGCSSTTTSTFTSTIDAPQSTEGLRKGMAWKKICIWQ